MMIPTGFVYYNTFMHERQFKENWYTFICPLLIFTGDAKENIVPSASFFHHAPGLRTPFIRFIKGKIRGNTDSDKLTALNPISSAKFAL